jgi:hypothetical protein
MSSAEQIPQGLSRVLTDSAFFVAGGTYICVKTPHAPAIGAHFMVTQDGLETTVITEEANLAALEVAEVNPTRYKLMGINVAAPFTCVGFLAAVTGAIAEKGIDLLAVSTYSRDYVLVAERSVEVASLALKELGMSVVPPVMDSPKST